MPLGLGVEIRYRIHKTNDISLRLQRSMMADSKLNFLSFETFNLTSPALVWKFLW